MTLHVSHLGASIALIEAADITPFITVKTVANNLKTLQVGMELKNTSGKNWHLYLPEQLIV